MNKKLSVISVIVGIMIAISVPSVTAQIEDSEIPSWIKGVANFWIEGGIDDADFIEALEFLIDNNVIKLGENIVVDNTMSELQQEIDILQEEIDILQEEIDILQEKLDTSEANRVSQSQSDAAQHKILYDEKDARYDKLKADYDERTEQKSKEYHEAIQKLEDELQELKMVN